MLYTIWRCVQSQDYTEDTQFQNCILRVVKAEPVLQKNITSHILLILVKCLAL